MLHALLFAFSLASPVLAVTPAIPPSEMGTIPDSCRADYDQLTGRTATVVAYRNSVALLTKGGAPVMPGPSQQRATDAFDAARGSLAQPAAPGPALQAGAALRTLYAAADPLDDMVTQYAGDLQAYVDTVAEAQGAEPARIAPPSASAPQAERETWRTVQGDVSALNAAIAKVDAALASERDAQEAYLRDCRAQSAASPSPTQNVALAQPTASPVAVAPGPSPAAEQLRHAFSVIIDWLKRYHDANGTYPVQLDRAILADADALNPFHTGFGYRAVRATYVLGTFTGVCACDDEMAAAFAAHDDWYENAGKHAPFHAPGIWYTPSVYFR